MNRSSVEAIGLVLATLNLDDVYPAQRELLREALADAKNTVCKRRNEMIYEQAKPLVEKLMNIAVLYHASPGMLRQKLHEALEYIPHLDAACLERGCPCYDPKEETK